MININLYIGNPFSKQVYNEILEELYYKNWRLCSHKVFEVQIFKFNKKDIFDFSFEIRPKTVDHAGWSFELRLFGFGPSFAFYDTRHSDQR
jgi:hypothetical protein